MLKTRIITAAILIPLMLLIIFYLPLTAFCLFTAVVTLMGAWEWTYLMQLKKISSRAIYLGIMTLLFFTLLFVPIPLVMMIASGWWVLALLMVAIYPRLIGWWSKSMVVRGLMGILVLMPCWMSVNYVRNLGNGAYTTLYLFLLVWGADTAAYFVGKRWGKNKLLPNVSPGKSIQGLLAALVISVVAGVVVAWTAEAPEKLWLWIIGLSLATVIASVVGDLFESMLKRNAGLKDSGVILPGHGGILDRIDSLTAAAPVYGILVFFMMMLAY